ncbi:MAG: hypothetical protein LBJ75_03435 [Puniceicoccales bacterium]|jgi:uncharacterized alkaline shock family protein YloU|nr:hypothetical protein [Puniceicoccales bacterium]
MKEILQNLSAEQLKCLFLLGGCIVGIVIIYILYLLWRPKRIFISKSDEGTVSLSKDSLNKIIESLARDVGVKDKIRTKVKCCRGIISIDISIRISRRQNLADISRALREVLQNVLINNVGLAAVSKINIMVTEFQSESSASVCKGLCQKEPINQEVLNRSNDQESSL